MIKDAIAFLAIFSEKLHLNGQRGEKLGIGSLPSLCALCASEGGTAPHTGFLPGPGHAGAAVLTFSPHFQEFIAR